MDGFADDAIHTSTDLVRAMVIPQGISGAGLDTCNKYQWAVVPKITLRALSIMAQFNCKQLRVQTSRKGGGGQSDVTFLVPKKCLRASARRPCSRYRGAGRGVSYQH